MPALSLQLSHPPQLGAAAARAAKPSPSCRRAGRALTTCAAPPRETEALFAQRVAASGYPALKEHKGLHPVAQEAWSSIHGIYESVFETPLLPAPWLAEAAGAAAVHLKQENKQASGSYRARGAAHRLLGLSPEQLKRGVAAAGSVNHTLAVLHAARAAAQRQGPDAAVPVRIWLAASAGAASHASKLRGLGAVVEEAASEAEAAAAARAAAEREGGTFIDAHNDERAAGGLGSIGCELLMQLPRGRLDAVFVPMSGGGLASGVAAVLKAADPRIKVVACRPRWVQRLAGTLAAPAADEGVLLMVDEVVEVAEEEAARAVVDTVSHCGQQVDVATGVAVAAFQRAREAYAGKHVVIVVCGGNISAEGMQAVYGVAAAAAAM